VRLQVKRLYFVHLAVSDDFLQDLLARLLVRAIRCVVAKTRKVQLRQLLVILCMHCINTQRQLKSVTLLKEVVVIRI
jgi:hypothetical protein